MISLGAHLCLQMNAQVDIECGELVGVDGL